MHSHRPRSLPPVALETLADRAGATVVGGGSAQGVLVTGVSLDSRTVRPGDLYAALPGAHAHGATFVAGAVAAGAVAVLTDPEGAGLVANGPGVPILLVAAPRAVLGDLAALVYGHPADAMRLIGVTGTNGKTTTAYLIESALRGLGARTGLIGTVETRVGDERLTSRRTTPEAPDLHAILAVMREAGTDSVVMEVSSHALAQHRVDGVVYDVALFTNLSQDHLDYHAGMADYFAAKAALFSPERAQRGVVCIDDEWGVALAQRRGIPLVTVSSRRPADWTLTAGEGPEVTLVGPGEQQLLLHCHLPGTFNLVNTAMAAVTLLQLGYAASEVERAMALEPVVPGRMERVPGGPDDPRCVVDYAHTPEAVDAALAALRPSTAGRLVVVLGAGGDRDTGKRAAMGAAGARWADDLIVTDDNPRSEDPAVIREQVLAGARSVLPADPDGTTCAPSLFSSDAGRAAHIERAVRLAREQGRPGDNTVVVLGKGHETGQDIGGTVHPFDDRDALAAALRGAPYRPEGNDSGHVKTEGEL